MGIQRLFWCRRKKKVKTFATWKSILMQDIADMRGMEGTVSLFGAFHVPKRMREVGLHCYQAEEHLTVLELCRLKNELEVNDLRWRWYKAKFVDGKSARSISKIRAILRQRQ